MGRPKGSHLTEEHKQKIGAANTGKKRTAEMKAKLSESHTGKKHPDEVKMKISAANKGRRYRLSPEAVANIALAQMGHKMHENTKEATSKYKNGMGRKVVINGMPYNSMRSASKALGIRYYDIVIMCRSHPERAAEHGLTVDWVENKGE